MYQSILVAVDGSADSNKAVDAAAELGAALGAQVHLAHVSEQHPLVLGSASVMSVAPEDELLKHGAAILDAAKSRDTVAGAKDLQLHNLVEPGSAAQAILKLADKIHADLLVVGSRGHGNLAGLMMGSVSQKLCQLSKCACLVVR